jgi:dolichol-phosphate mannosyltransferase
LTSSAAISGELAIINNFLWNDFWTFSDISSHQPGKRQRLKRLMKFNIVCLLGLVLNVSIVNFFFNILGINEYIAKLLAIAAVTVWNFGLILSSVGESLISHEKNYAFPNLWWKSLVHPGGSN